MTYEEMIEDETFIEEMQTRIMSDQEMDTTVSYTHLTLPTIA